MSLTFNFNLINGSTVAAAALILIAGGDGTFTVVRRNQRLGRPADPEAIEIDTTHAVQHNAAPGAVHGSGAATGGVDTASSEATGAADNASASTATGAVEVTVTVGEAADANALEVTGGVEVGVAPDAPNDGDASA